MPETTPLEIDPNEIREITWISDGTICMEFVHDTLRSGIWFDDEGDCGWYVVTKSDAMGCGILPNQFLTEIKTWLAKHR